MATRRLRGKAPSGVTGRMHGDQGGAIIEFAIITPFLFLLLFGIIEFGYALYQSVDVRHGAREEARIVAVNFKANSASTGATQTTEMIAAACGRMDAKSNVKVTITGQGGKIGDLATVVVSKPVEQLTGYLNWALGGKTETSTVTTRLEQDATWSDTVAGGQACP